MSQKSRGFTLLELLIVLVVLGIIAGLATPAYNGLVEQNRDNEAQVNLKAIYAGEKIYALNNGGAYWLPGNSPGTSTINSTLNIDINTQDFDISSIAADGARAGNTFIATATRNTNDGGGDGRTHTINDLNAYA